MPAGKRHALVQQVNVWLGEEKLCFGQVKVEKNSNGITAIPALLDMIDCKGALISIDAIGCQKQVVAKIVKGKADYLIALKSNQKGLYEQAHDHMQEWRGQLPCYSDLNKEQGRRKKSICEPKAGAIGRNPAVGRAQEPGTGREPQDRAWQRNHFRQALYEQSTAPGHEAVCCAGEVALEHRKPAALASGRIVQGRQLPGKRTRSREPVHHQKTCLGHTFQGQNENEPEKKKKKSCQR